MEFIREPIIFYTGTEAFSQLSDLNFIKSWNQLYYECPWATAFQNPTFVKTWYVSYKNHFIPVLIFQRGLNKSLLGLLTLALSTDNRELVCACQSEYQVWLALPGDNHFIEHALHLIRSNFPGRDLTLKYIPHNVPALSALERSSFCSQLELKTHRRPQYKIDIEHLNASFRKKSNKSRFNRLKRIGEVSFERITDIDRFEEIQDEVITYFEFRQGAINNYLPYSHDPIAKSFELEVMNENPYIVHITVSRVGGRFLAAHMGLVDKGCVHLGYIVHSPFYGKHAPGKLHLMLLFRKLFEENIEVFDLTPGGDLFKERFANEHDYVYELTLNNSRFPHIIRKASAIARNIVKLLMKRFTIRSYLGKELNLTRSRCTIFNKRFFSQKNTELCIYLYSINTEHLHRVESVLNKDNLSDLLKFEPHQPWQSKQLFLNSAWRRLERGDHVYTYISGNQLLFYGWVTKENKGIFCTELQSEFQYPEGCVVFFDFYFHPKVLHKNFIETCLKQMIADMKTSTESRKFFLNYLTANRLYKDVIEELGFKFISNIAHPTYLRTLYYI